MMRLKDKRAIITGGGTGIGKSIAQGFAEEGAHVLITGRRETPLKQVADGQARVSFLAADLTSEEGPRQIVEAAVAELGGVDILVNNAGVFETGAIDDFDEEIYNRQFDTNVRGLYRMTQAALPELRKREGGNIVNIGSILSFVGIPSTSVYAATKGAVAQLTRSFAVDLGPEGIRCNGICPGLIHTDLTDFMIGDPEFVKQNLPAYPIGRFGKTEDVANACVFLASDEASWITGVLLPVDGGYTAR